MRGGFRGRCKGSKFGRWRNLEDREHRQNNEKVVKMQVASG